MRADPGRLEQVFLNLLANAIEHAPGSGPIEVTVGTRGRARRGDGPRPRPRGRRRRTSGRCSTPTPDWATRIGRPGLGLGLYVAREIVTAHGGEIEAASEIGKGTVMTVRLPLADRRARRSAPATRAES